MSWKEFTVKTGYGLLRGKIWGESGVAKQRFLAVHGYLDNCNTFDPLMKLFVNKDRCVACLDFPGHNGLSSHIPKGLPYNPVIEILAMKQTAQHLGWDQFHLIGHSMGAFRAMGYNFMFPDDVQTLTSIDGWIYMPSDNPFTALGKQVIKFIQFENDYHGSPKWSTREEIRKKWLAAGSDVTEFCVDIMMERALEENDEGLFRMRRDPIQHARTNAVIQHSFETMKAQAKSCTRSQWMVIRSLKSCYASAYNHDELNELLDAFPNKGVVKDADGTHYVHMEQPEVVAEFINEFVSNYYLRKENQAKQ